MNLELEFRALTPDLWDDFESLFGERGACGGCWCMWFRLSHRQFEADKGERNREAMQALVAAGKTPGVLAYHGDLAVGWCSVAPREEFVRLERSRILKPVDDLPVWSIVCVFVAKPYRRRGVSAQLLRAAVEHVRARGGEIVEGYAVEPRRGRTADTFAFPGLYAAYVAAGYEEVARRSETRPIMRYVI